MLERSDEQKKIDKEMTERHLEKLRGKPYVPKIPTTADDVMRSSEAAAKRLRKADKRLREAGRNALRRRRV